MVGAIRSSSIISSVSSSPAYDDEDFVGDLNNEKYSVHEATNDDNEFFYR